MLWVAGKIDCGLIMFHCSLKEGYLDEYGSTVAGGTFAIYSLLCRRIGITPFGDVQSFEQAEESNREEEDFNRHLHSKSQKEGIHARKSKSVHPCPHHPIFTDLCRAMSFIVLQMSSAAHPCRWRGSTEVQPGLDPSFQKHAVKQFPYNAATHPAIKVVMS